MGNVRLPSWQISGPVGLVCTLVGAMLDIDVPGPYGGVQQALVYSTKDCTSARAAWRSSHAGKSGGKGSHPKPLATESGKGGLNVDALRKHTDDMSVVDWGVNGRYRLTECPRHRQFQPLVHWFLHSQCVPFLVGVLHYCMYISRGTLALASMYSGLFGPCCNLL